MTTFCMNRLDGVPHGNPCSVAYVIDGLTVATIKGVMNQRRPGGAWRIETHGVTGFILPQDRVTPFKGRHFRVDLPSRIKSVKRRAAKKVGAK